MMQKSHRDLPVQTLTRVQILTDSLRDVASELQLIDVADFVTFIRQGAFATIQDLVHSSVELFFKRGTLTYGAMAAYDVRWDRPPTITLGLEFHHGLVEIFFDLMLQKNEFDIRIRTAFFDENALTEAGKTKVFRDALNTARLHAPQP